MKRPGLVAALAIAALTLIVYLPVSRAAFVELDDPVYVTENPHVRAGLTSSGFTWAMTTGTSANWHPVTWLSHMLDVDLFGLDAGKHHVTSLLLHVANALLLFILLRGMTGAVWRSAFVAALFALHPLHVESVAWVAERKDLLSAFFFFLTIAAYLRWVQSRRPGRYALVLVAFTLGLMSKPMVVTLPFVLLLIDWWPLGRMRQPSRTPTLRNLVAEKVPLFVLAAASSVVTFLVQQKGGAVGAIASYPLWLRAENAVVSYVAYIAQMFWPARLIMLYPFPASVPAVQVIGGLVLLAIVSGVAVWLARARPYVAFGWFWYLGMLVPAIGVVQVGVQARADRYTYLPLVGLFIVITWGVWDLVVRSRSRAARRAAQALAVMVVLACSVVTRAQVGHWKDNVALWGHAIEVGFETDKFRAHNSLGLVLRDQGRLDEAIANFSEAVRLNPAFLEGHRNLGAALFAAGRMKDAIAAFGQALRLDPSLADVHNNLGSALANDNRMDEAVPHFTEAVRLKPDFAEAYDNLGLARAQQNAIADAVASFLRAVQLKPDLELAHVHLGTAYAALGRIDEAMAEFTTVLRLNPANDLAKSALEVLRQRRGRTGSV